MCPADVEFDVIWSNPPIRVGKEALHALLLQWIPRLRPGGAAYLVVQRHLGADSLHSLAGRCACRTTNPSRYDVRPARQRQGLPGPRGHAATRS